MTKHLKIFAIGAGGSGMSGLIRLLKSQGHTVTGSDQSQSEKIEQLKKEGIRIFSKHEGGNITSDINEVIYSQAIPTTNPELLGAKKHKIPTLTYPQALGKYMIDKTKICIAGTHGKTTTTAMIAAVLIAGKKDPTVIVGAEVKELGGKNERLGKSEFAVLETCEYKKSFLDIPPDILIITNIDFDHIDFYKNQKNYDNAFVQYIKMVPKNGAIFYMKDDVKTKKILAKLEKTTTTKNIFIKPVVVESSLRLSIPGEHNRRNASLAHELARHLSIPEKTTKKSLLSFSGTKRRLEYKGSVRSASNHQTKIYDDYGHHPTEIKATLSALRELYPTEKVLTIFQPHQFSRTKAFLKDFSNAFKQTDAVIIPNIYEARDSAKDKKSMPLEKLVAEISKHHKNISSGESISKTIIIAKKLLNKYDVIITMGAGDVYKISDALIQ